MSILRFPKVKEATGLSKSHIYGLIAKGEFPAPVRLSARAVGWQSDAVNDWLTNRPSARAEG